MLLFWPVAKHKLACVYSISLAPYFILMKYFSLQTLSIRPNCDSHGPTCQKPLTFANYYKYQLRMRVALLYHISVCHHVAYTQLISWYLAPRALTARLEVQNESWSRAGHVTGHVAIDKSWAVIRADKEVPLLFLVVRC